MYLIQGKNYPLLTPEEAIAMLTSGLDSALSQPPRPETVLACAGRFIEQLKDHAFLPQLGPAYREEVRKFCQPDALRQKLEHELGDTPFSVRRINYREPQFEGWRPLGVVVHVTPANAELLPFFAVIESLLVGNINWLRPSASEQGMTIDLLRAFIHCDLTDQLANFVAVVPVARVRDGRPAALFGGQLEVEPVGKKAGDELDIRLGDLVVALSRPPGDEVLDLADVAALVEMLEGCVYINH